MTTIIKTNKLTKYYRGHKVLGIRNLDLAIDESEIFGFIGPNGAGKSTTIRLLLDLIRPTSGDATIFGMDTTKQSVKIKREIGYLPGEIYLPENITGRECLSYYQNFKEEIDANYLKKLVSGFDLDLSKKVSEYSKGNKQKIAIVLAFMHKPKLLILDEPTSGLDPLNQQQFYEFIRETKKWGATTFLSTHILAEAEKICDRVGIIKEGKLIKIENIDEFRNKNIREMQIETKVTIPLADLQIAGIKKIERTTTGYNLTTLGHNAHILKHLSKFEIEDIKISEPSLEEIFMHYYGKKEM